MLVRSVSYLSVGLLFFALASRAQAEQGLPSHSMLSDMGLSGIVVMSDADAMAVRGLGYQPRYNKSSATAYGSSYASIRGYGGQARSEDGYRARGRRRAAGSSESYAGIVVKRKSGGGNAGSGRTSRPKTQVKKVVVFAGGSSYASTK